MCVFWHRLQLRKQEASAQAAKDSRTFSLKKKETEVQKTQVSQTPVLYFQITVGGLLFQTGI